MPGYQAEPGASGAPAQPEDQALPTEPHDQTTPATPAGESTPAGEPVPATPAGEHAPPAPWSRPTHVSVGRVQKPHGVRGEVKVEPLTPDPGRFHKLKRLFATAPDGTRQVVTIESVRIVADGVLLKFVEYDSPEDAVVLCGRTLDIPRSEARKAPPGQVLYADMIGLHAFNTETGEPIGTVKSIVTAGSDLLELETPEGDILIPWVPQFVGKPDLDAGTVGITPIPGLLEP